MGIRLNPNGLMMKSKAVQAKAQDIARAGILAFADAWGDSMERISPVSTGRFLRAWQQGVVDAGGRQRSLQTIRPNKRRDDLIKGLEDLIARRQATLVRAREVKSKLDRYFLQREPPRPPTTPWAQRAVAFTKDIPKMESSIQKMIVALAQLIDQPSAVVMGVLLGNNLNPERGRRVVYVRGLVGKKGVYGGKGEVIEGRLGRAVLRVTNREPHAKVVDYKVKATSRALASAKGPGIVSSRKIIRQILKELPANG